MGLRRVWSYLTADDMNENRKKMFLKELEYKAASDEREAAAKAEMNRVSAQLETLKARSSVDMNVGRRRSSLAAVAGAARRALGGGGGHHAHHGGDHHHHLSLIHI